MTEFGLSELELKNKRMPKTFFILKIKCVNTKNLKCHFQGMYLTGKPRSPS